MRTLEQIIEACGGPGRIETAAGTDPISKKPKLSHWAVRKWPGKGIPERHWSLVKHLSGATVEELHGANRLAREAAA